MSTFDDLQKALGGTYQLERELGGGGMSRVFLANDAALGRKVVLKVLPADLAAVVNVERFNRETLLLARLQHPHIVPVLTVGSLHGLPWFSMPYIEGESLRARIERERALPIADVVSVLRDVSKALAYAHERGVVHRDIKPDNILLTGDAATVADFGIAKAINAARTDHETGAAAGEALTAMGVSIGTPAYMSPEQIAASETVDHRTDLYALGCVAYEMLCGQSPFAGRPFQALISAHLTEKPELITTRRSEVPAALASLVMQCLEKEPTARPKDAREVLQALEQASLRSGERTASMTTRAPARRTGLLVLAGALLAGVAFVGLRAAGIGPWASLQARGTFAARERLAFTDFTTTGTDSLLGRVAADAVRAGLVQSTAITLLTPTEVAEALGRMQRPRESRLSLALTRELATREGVRAIVDGDLTAIGADYVLAVRLVTADSGRELVSYRATVGSADGLIQAADKLSRQLRSKIGESLSEVNASPPLERVTTSSLDALRRYSAGVRAIDVEGNPVKAATLLREAVALDTLFAEGWRRLGLVLASNTANPGAADSALGKAYALRDRLTEIEAQRVVAAYYSAGARADRVKAIAAYERVLALGDSSVLGSLASRYDSRREFARGEVLRRLLLQRDSGIQRLSALRTNLLQQGKWSAVDSIEATVRRRFPTDQMNRSFARSRAQMAGDMPRIRLLMDSAATETDKRDAVQTANRQMFHALDEGRLRDADRFREASMATYRAQGIQVDPADDRFLALETRIDAGAPTADALRAFEAASRAASPTVRVRMLMSQARAYAKLHMVAEAKAALAAFDRAVTSPLERTVTAESKATTLKEIAIAEGRWADAAAMVRRADQKPDGPANSCVDCMPLELLRVFAFGGQADSALAQYELYKRTPAGSRPRVGPDMTVSAVSMLALARIYDARGDARNAALAYRDYAARYERADAELQPTVREARARALALSPGEEPRR